MTAFEKAWDIAKADSNCSDCGSKGLVRYVALACSQCHEANWDNPNFDPEEADWIIDSISAKEQLNNQHLQCPLCEQNTGKVRYWDMVCPDCYNEWMDDI